MSRQFDTLSTVYLIERLADQASMPLLKENARMIAPEIRRRFDELHTKLHIERDDVRQLRAELDVATNKALQLRKERDMAVLDATTQARLLAEANKKIEQLLRRVAQREDVHRANKELSNDNEWLVQRNDRLSVQLSDAEKRMAQLIKQINRHNDEEDDYLKCLRSKVRRLCIENRCLQRRLDMMVKASACSFTSYLRTRW